MCVCVCICSDRRTGVNKNGIRRTTNNINIYT